MSFPRYPKYKDSGVEWLGEVPQHWGVKRLRQFGQFLKGSGGSKEDIVETGVPCVRYGDLYTTHGTFVRDARTYLTPDRARDYTPIIFGDVLFAGSGETFEEIGKSAVNLMKAEARCGGDVILFRPTAPVHARFMGYACDSHVAASQKAMMGRGTTVKHIYPDDLRTLALSLPPMPEQRAIATFLDRETAKIDALVAEQQRLMDLLKEKRQAVISHAVTKGLNPDAPMKASGIEWLGDVPAHWKVLAIKRLSPVMRGASPRPIDDPKYFDEEGEYGWVRIADVSASDGLLRETVQRLSALGSSLSVKIAPGKLFVSIAGTVGKPCISGIAACIHDGFVYFPVLNIDPRFLYRVFEAGSCYGGLGKWGTQLNLNTDTIGAIRVALPPVDELKSLLEFLDRETAGLDALAAEAQRAIDLLQERRAALISAAVTGQIDVRGLAPSEAA